MKRKYMLGFCFVSFTLLSMSINLALAEKPTKGYTCELVHGEYLDSDKDGLADDLLVIAELNHQGSTSKGTLNMFMYLSITYPSGEMIDFLWKVSVYQIKNYTFEYHVYNGVLEPGWYTAELSLSMDGLSFWDDTSVIVFDPPLESKNGDPTTNCMVMVY